MIRTPSKIEYLDHIFIANYKNNFYKNTVCGTFNCNKCNLYVCLSMRNYYINSCQFMIDEIKNIWKELNITCNEVIIKNIIE